jgi:hypothetical protein
MLKNACHGGLSLNAVVAGCAIAIAKISSLADARRATFKMESNSRDDSAALPYRRHR